MKDTDLITTVVGAIGGVITAVTPVMDALNPAASMHQGDWLQLGSAAIFTLLGYFTNKTKKIV